MIAKGLTAEQKEAVILKFPIFERLYKAVKEEIIKEMMINPKSDFGGKFKLVKTAGRRSVDEKKAENILTDPRFWTRKVKNFSEIRKVLDNEPNLTESARLAVLDAITQRSEGRWDLKIRDEKAEKAEIAEDFGEIDI